MVGFFDHLSKMKHILVSDFKTHCVGLLNEVHEEGTEIMVTKRGRPLAKIQPPSAPRDAKRMAGDARSNARITGDIVDTGIAEDWESLK